MLTKENTGYINHESDPIHTSCANTTASFILTSRVLWDVTKLDQTSFCLIILFVFSLLLLWHSESLLQIQWLWDKMPKTYQTWICSLWLQAEALGVWKKLVCTCTAGPGCCCWLVAQCPREMLVYVRDRSAEAILCAATLRQKLQFKLAIYPSPSIQTQSQPVPALTL